MKIFSNMCCVLSSINFCTYFMFTLHKLSLFYGPGDAIASAARLWLLSTLSCPASCMWPPEVSDAVHCSPLWSCRSLFSFVFPSFWLYVHSRCKLFWSIVRSSSDSDVQSIVAACSVFCLLFRFWYLVFWIFLRFLTCLFSWLPLSSLGTPFQIL